MPLSAVALILVPAALGAAEAPVVDSLTASPATVAPGGTVTLTVEAHDPDCPETCTSGCGLYVRYDLTRWEADGGTFVAEDDGTSGSPYTASATWQAPVDEATYTLTVLLSDSGSFFCGGRQSTSASVTVLVTATTNEPPVIESLTASPVQLFPGETSELLCAASDPEDDPVTYSWDTDAGTVSAGEGGAAVFTADEPAIAAVTCTATDPAGAFAAATVQISVTGAVADQALDSELFTPQRLAVDSMGDVYVADRRGGGITVLHLGTGELVYRLPVPGIASVAVDWNDDLVVGSRAGAGVLSRRGDPLFALDPGVALGEVSDVAVDPVRRRYGVLYRRAGRVVVYGESGAVVAAFGSTGGGADELKSPQGLAATPAGDWVVADLGSGRLKVFDLAGILLASFGGRGGGAGEFVQLDDVAVDSAGLIYASDSFQDWVQVFNPGGTLREVLGTYGENLGRFKTAAGVASADAFGLVLAASLNGPNVQVFRTRDDGAPIPAPEASLSAAELVFASQAVDTTSPPRSVVLTNAGGAPLGVRRVTVAGDFAQTSDCGDFLDPGAGCTLSVTLTPAAAGPRTGSLVIETSAGNLAVALSGDGFVPPGVLLSPAELNFSDQEVGTTSEPKAVILTNPGTVPLLIGSLAAAGDDYAQANDCGESLAAGALCLIEVSFTPQTIADEIPGSLVIVSNAPGGPHAVALDGRGIPGAVTLAIADVTVSEGDVPAVAELPVTLSSPSAVAVTVGYSTTGDTAEAGEDFEAVAGTLEIAAGETAATIAVPVVDDDLLEPDEETFTVELANPVHATLERAAAVATIADDELCPGPELLANPGAEERGSAGLPGWTGAGDWQRRTAEPEPLDGRAYFAAGSGELVQEVDVAAYAEAVAGGGQSFFFEAWIRTAGDGRARVVVEYRDPNGTLLDAFDSGAEESAGEWRAVADVRPAPAETGRIAVRLAAAASMLGGKDLGGVYFDALTLRSLRAAALSIDDLAVYEGDTGLSVAELAVRLSCPYYRPVEVDYATADGTAVAGEDYLAAGGSVEIAAGETGGAIPVEIVGDEEDEGHETFSVGLDLVPGDDSGAVVADGEGLAVIVNDDFCARGAGYWKNHPSLWPVEYLVIGGVEYGEEALSALLGYRGPDAAAKLARQLVATLLNLETGSEPSIWPVVDSAQAFLNLWPPGSAPAGVDRQEANRLKNLLEGYNGSGCPGSGLPGSGLPGSGLPGDE